MFFLAQSISHCCTLFPWLCMVHVCHSAQQKKSFRIFMFCLMTMLLGESKKQHNLFLSRLYHFHSCQHYDSLSVKQCNSTVLQCFINHPGLGRVPSFVFQFENTNLSTHISPSSRLPMLSPPPASPASPSPNGTPQADAFLADACCLYSGTQFACFCGAALIKW